MSEISQKQLEANRENAKLGGVKTNSSKKLVKQDISPDKIEKMRSVFKEDSVSDDALLKEYGELVAVSKNLTPKQKQKKDYQKISPTKFIPFMSLRN